MTVVTALFIYCVLLIFTRASLKSTATISKSFRFPRKFFLIAFSIPYYSIILISYYYSIAFSSLVLDMFSSVCYDIADTFDVIIHSF